MQPSQLEIQREVEALRDIRRRSTAQGGPGALILDPDLPNPSSPTSPTASYWAAAAATQQQLADGDSSSGSHEDSSSSEERAAASDDPFHLFWVPARLHPEIAPAEFRNFLKEHARTPPPDDTATTTAVGRSNSFGHASPGLDRRRSMLSRQYKPSEHDDVEEEKIVPMQRRRSTLVHARPQLTINDLQRLEELAEEASNSDDPSKFRAVLRRSLSLNMAPSADAPPPPAIDTIDNISEMPDEADAPIIVPPPGQILRRSARTKIRKSNQSGEGAPHRFGPGRRHRTVPSTEQRISSDLSSNDHASTEPADTADQYRRPRPFSDEPSSDNQASQRPDSFSEETSIYDAYVREEADLDLAQFAPSLVAPLPSLSLSVSAEESMSSTPDVQDASLRPPTSSPSSVVELQHPQPQRPLVTPSADEGIRTGSTETLTFTPSTEDTLVASPSTESIALPGKSASPAPKKEKDKKGLFGKWGSDKNSKRAGKDRDREKDSQRGDKESGFFGSLFGKKKHDEQGSPGYSGQGRETATALLGASKSSKSYVPSPSPQPGPMGYARYPIHVERAIYRLSHIKLANPRRPLYEQVLISNLMFWYLGVINKTQNPAPAQGAPAQSTAGPAQSSPEKEHAERERHEVEERQRAEKERLERERQEQEKAKEMQMQQQKKEPRRGALTKATAGQPGGRRTAEMPVKGPQYEMQHRVMEQEYNAPGYGYGAPPPASSGVGGGRALRQQSASQQMAQPDAAAFAYVAYSYGDDNPQQMSPSPGPGVPADPSWSPTGTPSPPMSRTPSSLSSAPNGSVQPEPAPAQPPPLPPQHRSRSPPPPNHNRYAPVTASPGRPQGAKGAMRSLSATAASPASAPADGKTKKIASMHAVPSATNGRPRASIGTLQPSRGEEEDVPLAVWQQQRRR
ncbi:hypothetical protein ID866_3355 [Astraeus odoratus]|nr:hypothetical protein ID866_3355 [Astraeus odoratus]